MIRTKIIGTGSSVPERVLTNSDLEQLVDTSDDWIFSRTGIRERRIAAEGEFTSTFATNAGKQALHQAGVSPQTLDLIIVATVTPDFPFPATACLVQKNLQAVNAVAFDISAACSGFIYALSIADQYIRSGAVRTALIIGAEVLSRIVDWSDRSTCCLFGDGAGAVVVTSTTDDNCLLSSHIHSDGAYWDLLHQPRWSGNDQTPLKSSRLLTDYLQMQGNEVFKHAVRAMESVAREALLANGLGVDDVNLFIPHQANLRIIDAISRRLGVPAERVYVNLDRFGNTSSASIPLALDEANREGKISRGDLIMFDAFGGGLTWGAVLLRW